MDALTPQLPLETLLIVDDEPLMTDLFRQYMTRRGFHVLTAESGAVALQVIEAEAGAIHLVISDMRMPDMDGIALAQTLAQSHPHLPVLIATGQDTSLSNTPLPPNIVGMVQKPYQNRVLAERIREILGSRV